MTSEKKIFAVEGTEYTLIKGKRWYLEYYIVHPFGVKERKRIYNPFNRIKDLTKREAAVTEVIRSIASGGVKKHPSLLLQVLEDYKHTYRTKTYESYKSILTKYYDWLGKSELQATTEDAKAFITSISAKGLSRNTQWGYITSISAFYNRVEYAKNPFKGMPNPKRQPTSLKYFVDTQSQAIAEYAQAHDQQLWLAIQLLYYCFIRPGEMRGLRIDDFNLQDGYIEVRSEISKNKKTQKVSLPAPLLSYIKANGMCSVYPGNYFVFSASGAPGVKQLSRNNLNNRHSQVLKALRIAGRYALYSWKHTGVVKAAKAGIKLKDLQLQLRHYSLDMVNEYLKNLGVMDSEELRFNFPVL